MIGAAVAAATTALMPTRAYASGCSPRAGNEAIATPNAPSRRGAHVERGREHAAGAPAFSVIDVAMIFPGRERSANHGMRPKTSRRTGEMAVPTRAPWEARTMSPTTAPPIHGPPTGDLERRTTSPARK